MYKFFLFASLMLIATPTLAADPTVPDLNLTPGEVHTPPTPLATLCTPGYTKTVRNVSDSLKEQVFREYGLDPQTIDRGSYEIDHDISLGLDGTNDIKNLWPESYISQPYNAHTKDPAPAGVRAQN
jgi:hypothetical protein